MPTVQVGGDASGEEARRGDGQRAPQVDHAGNGAAVNDLQPVLPSTSGMVSLRRGTRGKRHRVVPGDLQLKRDFALGSIRDAELDRVSLRDSPRLVRRLTCGPKSLKDERRSVYLQASDSGPWLIINYRDSRPDSAMKDLRT